MSWNYISGNAPDDVPDAQVAEPMQPFVRKLLDQELVMPARCSV